MQCEPEWNPTFVQSEFSSFYLEPPNLVMFIFLAPTHLDKGAEPISEFEALIGQDRKIMRKIVCTEGPQNLM